MNNVEMMGITATVITTIYTCFGLPVQIYKSIRHRSVSGLSLVNTLMMLLTFSSWVVYASLKTPVDYYVVISNTPGALCSLIILGLFSVFGKNSKDSTLPRA